MTLTLELTTEDFLEDMHEALMKGYKNQLKEIQKLTGASDENAEAAIKEADEGIKKAFFAAAKKLEK